MIRLYLHQNHLHCICYLFLPDPHLYDHCWYNQNILLLHILLQTLHRQYSLFLQNLHQHPEENQPSPHLHPQVCPDLQIFCLVEHQTILVTLLHENTDEFLPKILRFLLFCCLFQSPIFSFHSLSRNSRVRISQPWTQYLQIWGWMKVTRHSTSVKTICLDKKDFKGL